MSMYAQYFTKCLGSLLQILRSF